MDVLRFTTLGAVGFLLCGISIGAAVMAARIKNVPLWVTVFAICWAMTLLAGAIVAIAVANPVAGGG